MPPFYKYGQLRSLSRKYYTVQGQKIHDFLGTGFLVSVSNTIRNLAFNILQQHRLIHVEKFRGLGAHFCYYSHLNVANIFLAGLGIRSFTFEHESREGSLPK